MPSELNYQDDLEIDIDSLEVEWLQQAQTYMRYGEAAAQARKRAKEAEEAVKVMRSKLVKEAKKLLSGATVQEIEAYYREDKRHKNVKSELIDAEYEADVLGIAEKAFDHRRRALENLVRLWEKGYFSEPREPKGSDIGRKSRGRFSEDSRKKLTESVNRRRMKRKT